MHIRSKLISSAGAMAICIAASPAWSQVRRAVRIQSTPPGATVRLDNATAPPLGQTPIARALIAQGPHRLFFDLPGYVQGSLDVTVAARNTRPFAITLVQGGNVYVAADVDGAPIFLDGTQMGVTPGRLNNVPPGAHIIELRMEGREPVRETVNVTSGTLSTVNVTLRPRVAPTGSVRVIVSNPNGPVPADLQVSLDGTPLTGTPPSSDTVQPGTHIIQVAASGFRSMRREVTVTAGQAQAVAVDLEVAAATSGSLRVIVPVAGAQAFLDGEALTLTGGRVDQASVSPGQHTVRVTAPGRDPVVREVAIVAGQQRVLEFADSDLPPATGRGRLRVVVANNPEAEIFVNSQTVGRGSFSRDNVSDGEVVVLVRASGFNDFTQRCNVTATQPCEVNAQLERTAQFGTIHVTAPALSNAQVFLNDETQGRPLGDIGNVPVGNVRVTVRADNYEPWVREVNVREGDNPDPIVAAPRHTGPDPVDIARRRSGISTFGAAPLTRGDGAFDAILSYGAMPVELRATMGFVPHNSFPNFGNFTIDGGIAVRTAFNWYEVELRSRAGWRFANDLIALGGEVRAYGALGFRSSRGFGMVLQGNMSFHFNMGSDAQTATGQAPVGGVGAFTISLNGGLELNLDNPGGYNLTLSGNRDAAYTLCDNRNADASSFTGSTCEVSNTARGFAGIVAELGLFRHLSFVLGATLYLPFPEDIQYDSLNAFTNAGSNVSRRPITTSFWDAALPINLRLGVTYKF